MRLYVDMRCLQDPGFCFRGVGCHSATVLKHARSHFPKSLEVVGLLDSKLGTLPEQYAILPDRVQFGWYPRLGYDFDLFFQPSPMTHDQSRIAPFLGRLRLFSFAIVHDFIPVDLSEIYLKTSAALRNYISNLVLLKHYNLLLSNSNYSLKRALHVANVERKKIEVTGIAFRKSLISGPQLHSVNPVALLRDRYIGYFLVVGGDDPRKNVEVVIKAHAQHVAKSNLNVGLVIIGHYCESKIKELKKLSLDHGGHVDSMFFLEGLTDAELGALYSNAIATICPSFLEGFSMPVVEAVACGCPALVSDCEAHLELVSQPFAIFSPDDFLQLSRLMAELTGNASARENLLAEQRSLVSKFTEEAVCQRFWSAVVSRYDDYRRRLIQYSKPEKRKPKIAFVTPYPPDRSGIAEYTAQSLKTISKHAIIDVFTNAKTVVPDPSVRAFFGFSQFPYVVDDYDRVVSIIGNSHYHKRVIELFCHYGGAAIAHDNRLAELYYFWLGPERFAEFASQSLGRKVSVQEAEEWIQNPALLPCIFFDEILKPADPLIVHSRGIQSIIRKQYGQEVAYLPFCCYRHFQDEELLPEARQMAKKRLGLPLQGVIIITLGLVSGSKGPFECIWSLEQVNHWGLDAHLFFAGSTEHYNAPLKELACQLGIGDKVHLMDGWLSEEVYRDYLLAADLAIQLRSHRLGGLSGALMDCISAGLPTVCNHDLGESMEAPDFVIRVPDNFSPVLIAESILNICEAGLHETRLRDSRSAYLSVHNFEHYAEQLMSVIGLM